MLDLIMRMKTQLSLWLYKDWVARSNNPGTPYSHQTIYSIRDVGHKPQVDVDAQTPMTA